MTAFVQYIFNQVVEVAVSLKAELLLFVLAFTLHHTLFRGNVFLRHCKGEGPPRAKKQPEAPRRAPEPTPGAGEDDDAAQALQNSQAAYDRGDHRAVLRYWNQAKQCDEVPAAHLARVVEAMQRFKKDSVGILVEIRGYLRRNPAARDVRYLNRLLEPLARSLDTDVVRGVVEAFPELGVQADSATYELLIQMHFATRSFDEVAAVAAQMRRRGAAPTPRTSLALLKAALQTGQLDEAMRCYKEVAATRGSATASSAPGHLAAQLVELACRDRRAEVVLGEIEAGELPLNTDMVNALLAESARGRDAALAERVERLVENRGTAKNGRTFGLLVRGAGGDAARIAALLDEMAAAGAECVPDVAQAVLAVCVAGGDTELADRLYKQLKPEIVGQTSVILALLRFYAEAGQPEKACEIYDEHVRGRAGDDKRRSLMDSRTEKSLVAAAVQCGRKELATALLEAAPSDTARHISMIRACAAKGDLQGALATFRTLESSGAELTHSLWNTVLDACVECRDLPRAEELMRRMVAAGNADVVSYNTVIKAHLRCEHFDRARGLMDEMQAVGCKPNHVTYNELINSLMRFDKDSYRAEVWEVVDEMKRGGVQPNRITCSILLKSLRAKSSQADVTKTMDLTDCMEEPMDEVLLSSIVEACVRVGNPTLLSQKLEQLRRAGAITVTGAHTFGSLIKAHGYVRDIAGAWRCWKEMRSQHIRPTSITVGCMVEAVVTNGDVDGGYELISGLLEDERCRDQVNAVVFGSLLKGYARARRMERVWAVYQEMVTRAIEPSLVTFNALVDACARNGQMDRVPGLLSDMRQRGLEPNLITYSTMIKGSCQRGDMSGAFAMLEELRRASAGHSAGKPERPDEVVYNTLLDGCAQAGLVAEGERLLAEMQDAGVAPSNYTLTVAVRLMGQARRVERAFELAETLSAKYRFRLNSHVCCALIQACLTARDPLRAAATCERAARERLQLDARICQNLIRALLSLGQHMRAVGLLRTMMGLNGQAQPLATSERRGEAPAFDDSFVNEVVSALRAAGSDAAFLAAPLVADLRGARRPRAEAGDRKAWPNHGRRG